MATNARNSHKDLILWCKAMDLATDAHRLTRRMPRYEIFGLVSQVRRAAISIPSNIAEGPARRSTREFLAFLHIAHGSSAELETQLQIARNVGYVAEPDLEQVLGRLDEVGRLLNAVIAGLRRRQADAS